MSTYTQADAILSHIYDLQTDIWTTIPAIVDNFNSTKQTVDCTISVSRRLRDGGHIPAAKLYEIPVVYSGGKDTIFYSPLQKGDMVLLNFSSMPVDEFLAGEGKTPTVPKRMRYHDISDAFAIPGVFVRKKPTRDEALKDIPHIKHKETTISFKDNGDLDITSTGDVNTNCVNSTTTCSGKATITATSVETNCNVNVTGGDVIADGVSLKLHTHIGSPTAPVGSVSPTGVPVPTPAP